jgi:hypothetical protein
VVVEVVDGTRRVAHDGAMSVVESNRRDHRDPPVEDGSESTNERSSRQELRQLLLGAAQDIMEEEGVQTASTNLTFKRVFERVERTTGRTVTNASVIRRVWDNMADFQADVLINISRDERRPELDRLLEAIGRLLDECDLSTPESRGRALQELCRTVGQAITELFGDSTFGSAWIAVLAIATTAPDPVLRDRMVGALMSGYDTVADFWEPTFSGLFGYLGFRIRDPLTVRQFTEAALAWSQGHAVRHRVTGGVPTLTRATGPAGESEEWTLFSVGLEGLVHQFFELDPAVGAPDRP